MRLSKIEIIHFGKLSNVSFELDKNLNLFLGNNEAGKSTIVAFIKQVLFGFHLKSKKSKFFEDYFPLDHVSPMGGKLFFEDEKNKYILERLYAKGDPKKGILTVFLNGQEVPEATFFNSLKNIDDDFYTDSFIFNQDLLAEVTGLDEKQLIERIYFLGAAQSNKLLSLRDKYGDEAGKLFKPTGKKPIINQLISQIKSQKELVGQAASEYEDYQKLDQEKKDLLSELTKFQKELAKLKKKQQQLQLLQTKEKNFVEYQNLKAKYQPVEFSQENFDQIKSLDREIKVEKEQVEKLKKQIQDFDLDQNQVNTDQINGLLNEKAEFLQWQSQLNNLSQQVKRLNDEIKRLESYQPELVKLQKYNDQSLAELKTDYQRAKQESQTLQKQTNIVPMAISGLVLLIGLILVFSQQNLMIGILLILAGIGAGIYFLRPGTTSNSAQKLFEDKYPFDLNSFDLDNSLSQLVNLLSKQEELKHDQTEITKLNQAINTYISQISVALNQELRSSNEVNDALNSLHKLLEKQQNARFKQNNLKNQIIDLNLKIKTNEAQLNKLLVQAQVKSLAELDKRRQLFLEQEKIKLQLATLKNNLAGDLKELQTYRQNHELDQELSKINDQIIRQNSQVNEKQQAIADVKAKQNNLADSDAVFNSNQQLANLKAQLRQESTEYLSDLIVTNWISRSLDLASNERFPKMLSSAKEYFGLLTNGRYHDLDFEKGLTVKNKNNKKVKVQYLSRGTSEQLYFALKLAFVEQIADEISLPVLIDDAFVNFDQQRIDNIINLLELLSQKTQVIIFTQRVDLANQLNCKVIDLNQEN
ncbi:AAA family ATPase [Lactobacillus rodentium]|uniref:DNA repair ATPase n=1 Tax=Lactobacillus rodentium TaxID=947835 RepID=A0A2Z6T6N9_9LACO|nr:AAA family ATPase [Lactobacillus rodentium]MCR1894240.1 AAA family ATPase [Lactobacillus rodentium]GBG04536.1 DNA repair ATPase [Lactobacillus rodentium]